MDWSGVMERYGWKKEVAGTEPFHPLALQAQQCRANGESVARISSTVGTAASYGEAKVSFTVSIDCPQNDTSISLAGECCFKKAMELTDSGTDYLGIPRLQRPE